MALSYGAHSPHPHKHRTLPSRPPHPATVSQWLGVLPGLALSLQRRAHPYFLGKGKEETVWAREERGTSFSSKQLSHLGWASQTGLSSCKLARAGPAFPGKG